MSDVARDPVVIRDASFVASAADVRDLPPPLFAEVAFAGKSNVGKSSLLNCLLARKQLVRVSQTPGCTRGLNLFRVELADGTLDLVDLPGYGYAKRSKHERAAWGPMIERFLEQRAGLSLVVVIVDARRGLDEEDGQLLEFLEHIGRPVALVATKLDKLKKSEQKPALARLERAAGARPIGFSSETHAGRGELWRRIFAHVRGDGGGNALERPQRESP